MSSPTPWLTLAVARTFASISVYDDVFETLNLAPTAFPMLTLMIGKKTKSDALGMLTEKSKRNSTPRLHGQVYVHTDRSARTDAPTIYVDYELQSWDNVQPDEYTGSSVPQRHTIDLLARNDERWSRRRVGNMICGRGIAPVCDTLCYFAMDLGGIKAVAASLAEHMVQEPSSEMPHSAMPRVLVVVETVARTFDPHTTEARILELTEEIWRRDSSNELGSFTTRLRSHYYDVRVIGLNKRSKNHQRCVQLRKRLLCIKREVHLARVAAGLRFRKEHLFAFTSKLIRSIQPDSLSPFSFIAASRPAGLHLDDFARHIREVVSLIPSEIWLCHLIVPLLSSSIILATYPPGSHRKYRYTSIWATLTSCSVSHIDGLRQHL
jgi:hypothetical protein